MRLERRLSQEGLANDAHLDHTYIQGFEKGGHNISITVFKKTGDCPEGRNTEFLLAAMKYDRCTRQSYPQFQHEPYPQ